MSAQQPVGGSTTTVIQSAVNERGRNARDFIQRQLQQGLAFATLVVLFAVFSLLSPNFLSFSNVSSILLSTAVVGILAVGTTFVIITGGIDLSLGTGMALCAVMAGVFMTNMGLPMWVGVIGAIATGALMGLINGICITVLRLPPFIATLAMMMIAGGLALVLSDVKPIYFNAVPEFQQIFALAPIGQIIGENDEVIFPGIPSAVIILAVLTILAAIILQKTVLGRFTFAIGSNEEAVRLSGVNTAAWTVMIYVFAGVFTGIAGVVFAARLGSAQPQAGTGYELQAIAAVIIGGTSLLGGRGSILGTIIGALIMGVLVNGLRIVSVPTQWQNIVVGIVIVIAVFFDSVRSRRAT